LLARFKDINSLLVLPSPDDLFGEEHVIAKATQKYIEK
jgi:hypothetical protein